MPSPLVPISFFLELIFSDTYIFLQIFSSFSFFLNQISPMFTLGDRVCDAGFRDLIVGVLVLAASLYSLNSSWFGESRKLQHSSVEATAHWHVFGLSLI